MAPPSCFIGLMSGTSLDGVDGVLAHIPGDGRPQVLQHASCPLLAPLRAELLALNSTGPDELHRAALAGNALSEVYAQVVETLLAATGTPRDQIRAIGAHGQTVRHRPLAFDGVGYTLQLQNPSLLAERTGIDVVADFRSRDLAAGGQGAPLVPAFHAAWFGQPDRAVAVLNIGGISNLSLLPADAGGSNAGAGADGRSGSSGSGPIGFDCGPGNALLDHWCRRHTGQPYDDNGAWAASGTVMPELLAALMHGEPFFDQPPPKSTGRDLFNPAWLDARLAGHADAAPADVQATLTEMTVCAAAACASSYGNESKELIVCGGGAYNGTLMRGLARHLSGMAVVSSEQRGLPPLQVEATAFAWLARRTIERQPGNLPAVTGARGLRVLGAVYPA